MTNPNSPHRLLLHQGGASAAASTEANSIVDTPPQHNVNTLKGALAAAFNQAPSTAQPESAGPSQSAPAQVCPCSCLGREIEGGGTAGRKAVEGNVWEGGILWARVRVRKCVDLCLCAYWHLNA